MYNRYFRGILNLVESSLLTSVSCLVNIEVTLINI